ncbi:MAG TPA: response regulator [Vicinamibacterales bacterium]|nr:response regulator [Vicinamibacterales bacterium]
MPPVSTDPSLDVLVVDDDNQLLRTLSDILKHRGYSPHTASSGSAGLALATHGTVAIALVDLRLPDMDGLEVVAELRRLSQLTETVILTGHASVDSAVRALREQSHDYLVKPVAPDQLFSTLTRASERWRRRHAEEALRRAEERSLLLLENISDIIAVVGDEGRIEYASPSLARTLGYDQDSIRAVDALELVHPEDRSAVAGAGYALAAEPGSVGTVEARVLHLDGTWRTLEGHVTNLLDRSAVRGFLVSARDVTDARALELQMRQAQKMETVGNLAGGMAHDFNNVLTAVIGYSELSLAMPDLDPAVRADLEEIRRAGERAAQLTRHLLAFARKQPAEPRLIDVSAVIRDLARMLQRLIGEHIVLDVRAAPLGVTTRADPLQIEQVLMNLAVNARDAMPDGGSLVVETALAELRTPMGDGPAPGRYVRLTVTDSGTGMPEEVRTRAFEPFFTTKESGKGTGLGLATCYGILKQSGGAIVIESEMGRGTAIHTYWPLVTGTAVAHDVEQSRTSGPGRERILVVDDDDAVRRMAETSLRRHGYDVELTATAEAALALIEGGQPVDLLLTDVILTRMNGVDLAARGRQLRPGLRVLFMSGYDATAGKTTRSGPMIPKPFTPAALTAKIREVLDR